MDTGLPEITMPQREVEPAPPINRSVVGWQGAKSQLGGVRISDTLRASWVQLNSAGGIDGRVDGINEPIDVFLLRNGFVVSSATTAADGSYRVEAATPGTYTIVGYSKEGIFATGFLAVASDGTATGLPQTLVSRPVLGAKNKKLVGKLIQEFAPDVVFRDYGSYEFGEGPDDPPEFYGFEGLKNLRVPATPSNVIDSRPITLGPGGTLVGRIHQANNLTGRPVEVLSTRVMVIQDGEILAEVQVDNAGVFEFTDLTPGEYGIVGVGSDGIVTLGVELIDDGIQGGNFDAEAASAFNESGPIFNASARRRFQANENALDATLVGPESTGWLNNYVTEQLYIEVMLEPLPEMGELGQMPYDYFNNDMYGGGGGGGGGGGLGGGFDWILPIGIAAIIAAAVDDNDDFNNAIIPPPQSPF